MTAILKISNGTTEIDLIHGDFGFILYDWRPQISDYKGGGVWQGSSISEGRQLVDKHFGNVIESFDLKARNSSQDVLIQNTQDLRRMLEDAADYWTQPYNSTPVYLIARAGHETNTRYAVIRRGRLVDDDNPFRQPFLQPMCRSAMDNLALIIERGHWQDVAPGSDTCLEITASDTMAVVYPLEFDGLSGDVNCGTDASLDDLPDNAVAGKGVIWVDGWIRPDSQGEGNQGKVICKGSADATTRGWHVYVSANGLFATVDCATQDATAASGLDEFDPDDIDDYVYFAMCYSETGVGLPAARTIYLNIGGSWVTSYVSQQVSIGNYSVDNGDSLLIGNDSAGTRTFEGGIGWLRVLDVILHNPDDGDFTAPPMCPLPDFDTNTLGLWIHEGEGSTAYNVANVGTSDGTITDADWGDPCTRTYGFTGDDCYSTTSQSGIFYPAATNDDCRVDLFNSVIVLNNNLWIGFNPSTAAWSVGIRFKDVSIPPNAIITTAFLRLRGAAAGVAGGVDVDIAIEDAPGTVEFSTVADFSGRARGDIAVSHTFPVTAAGVDYDSASLVTIIQEAVDAGWWENGNNLTLFLDYQAGLAGRNEYEDVDDSNPPELHVTWTVETGDGDCACTDVAAYIANKQNTAQLTHIFKYDDSTAAYSGNLLGATAPFEILPNPVGDDDIVYFGVDTTLVDSGPFCSLVFDLLTAATYGAGDSAAWEYWDGAAWSALTTRDNTASAQPFDTAGVNSVHWRHPSDWAANAINGVTAYWVRCIITVATAVTTPVQQNRDIYTVTWPYIEVANDAVTGDINALTRMIYDNVAGGAITTIRNQRLIMGARSVSRGSDFASFINVADEQMPTGVTVALTGFAFGNDITTVTGRRAIYNIPAGNTGTITIIMDSTVADQYAGRYRFMVRGKTPSTGTDTEVDITYEVWMESDFAIFSSDTYHFPTNSVNEWVLIDLGEISLPGTLDTPSRIAIEISFTNSHASTTYPVYIMDAILIPVDEWSAELKSPSSSYLHLDNNTYLDVGSTQYPKLNIRAAARDSADDQVEGYWRPVAGAPMQIEPATNLRIYMLAALLISGTTRDVSTCEETASVTMSALYRYLSMRGNR